MAFSDVTRLKILERLQLGEKCATVLRELVKAGQSTLSHHMKILVDSGIVSARKEGKWTFYSISESGGRYAASLLKYITSIPKTFDKTASRVEHAYTAADDSRPEPAQICENNIKQRGPEALERFTIVVDTSSDLTPEFIKEHGIEVMPMPFILDGVEHSGGYWQDISGKEFYDALRNGSVANTSQINLNAFVETFTEFAEKGKDVIYLILSANLSATYQNSQIALADVKEKYPDCNIFPIDSISATAVGTLLTMLAVKKRSEGLSAQEAAQWLENKKHSLFGVFTVDDLMYLYRGGRVSKLAAVGGSLLGIKPILGINPDGSLGLKEKAYGRDASLKLLISQLERSVEPGTVLDTVLIPHTDCEEDALKLAGMVKEKFEVRQLEIILMGPVIGAHVGPGTVALVYEADMTRDKFENKFYKKS